MPDPQSDMPVELSERISASDAALAARVACGEAAALTPLYQRHRGAVYRFALLWSGSRRHRGRRDAGRVRAPSDPCRRLRCGVAARSCPGSSASRATSCTSARGSTPGTSPDEDDFELAEAIEPAHDEAIDSQRALERLRSAIAALPPHYRDVLVLVELAERSYAEAAAICGCELNTVRSRLFRARALVARALRASPDHASIARG